MNSNIKKPISAIKELYLIKDGVLTGAFGITSLNTISKNAPIDSFIGTSNDAYRIMAHGGVSNRGEGYNYPNSSWTLRADNIPFSKYKYMYIEATWGSGTSTYLNTSGYIKIGSTTIATQSFSELSVVDLSQYSSETYLEFNISASIHDAGYMPNAGNEMNIKTIMFSN